MMIIYRVKEENGSKMEVITTAEAAASVEGVSDITCNSTLMIREKITADGMMGVVYYYYYYYYY